MAARRITQATFDAAVAENVEEFDMEPEEALADAIEQFKAQGVDLGNIVTELAESKTDHPVLAPLAKLRAVIEAENDELAGAVEALAELAAACGDVKDHKSVAASNGALDLVAQVADAGSGDAAVTKAAFDAMRALVSKHADNRRMVPKPFVATVANTVVAQPEAEGLLPAALGLGATLCYRHEAHKRVVYAEGAAKAAVGMMSEHTGNPAVLRASLGLLRNVISNDDRSEPMSKAFDFARELAEEGMCGHIISVAKANASHAGITTDCFLTLRSACVNNTICTEVVEAGLLDLITATMSELKGDKRVVGAGAALLRTLAGNDDNKKLIGAPESPTLRVLLQAMQSHADEAKVAEHCCGALAALTLRSPDNAETMVASGAHTLIAVAMRKHSGSAPVCRQACLAVRNIVSRSTDLRGKILAEGMEKLLQHVRAAHPSAKDYAKAAMRDLGLEYGGAPLPAGAEAGIDERKE